MATPVVLSFEVDDKGSVAIKGINGNLIEMGRKLDDASRKGSVFDRAVGSFSSRLNSLRQSVFNVNSVLATLGASFAFGTVVRSSLSAFADSEQSLAKLEATLKSTGGAAGLAKDELVNLGVELQKTTKFGDEAVVAAEALLLTFTSIGRDVFPEAVRSILDISEAMGTDLKSSTIQLGKALNDPVEGITALTRVGVSFSESQKTLIKSLSESGKVADAQRLILAELKKEFGGVAEAAASTATGGLTQLRNIFGDIKELIGEVIARAFQPLIPHIKEAADAFQNFLRQTQSESIRTLESVFKGIGSAISFVARNWRDLVDITRVYIELQVAFLFTSIALEISSAARSVGVLTAAMNLLTKAGPFLLVTVFVLLVEGIRRARNESDAFEQFFQENVIAPIQKFLQNLVSFKDALVLVFRVVKDSIKSFIEDPIGVVVNTVKARIADILNLVIKANSGLESLTGVSFDTSGVEALRDSLRETVDASKDAGQNAGEALMDGFSEILKDGTRVKEAIDQGVIDTMNKRFDDEAFKNLGPGTLDKLNKLPEAAAVATGPREAGTLVGNALGEGIVAGLDSTMKVVESRLNAQVSDLESRLKSSSRIGALEVDTGRRDPISVQQEEFSLQTQILKLEGERLNIERAREDSELRSLSSQVLKTSDTEKLKNLNDKLQEARIKEITTEQDIANNMRDQSSILKEQELITLRIQQQRAERSAEGDVNDARRLQELNQIINQGVERRKDELGVLRSQFAALTSVLNLDLKRLEILRSHTQDEQKVFQINQQIRDVKNELAKLGIEELTRERDITFETQKRIEAIRQQTREAAINSGRSAVSNLDLGSLGPGGTELNNAIGGFFDIGAAGNQLNQIQSQFEEATRGMAQTSAEFRALETQRDQANFAARLSIASSFFGTFANLAKGAYEATGQKSKAAFVAYKAFAVAQAIIDTFRASAAAVAALAGIPVVGPALAFAAATTIEVAGALRVAQIIATEPAASATFATGGLVTPARPRTSSGARRSDEVDAVLHTGEFVLSRKGVAALGDLNDGDFEGFLNQFSKTRSALDDASRGSGSGSSSNVTVNTPPPQVRITQQNIFDPSIVGDYLDTRDGEQKIVNIMRRNG
jgi:hypothetical protein